LQRSTYRSPGKYRFLVIIYFHLTIFVRIFQLNNFRAIFLLSTQFKSQCHCWSRTQRNAITLQAAIMEFRDLQRDLQHDRCSIVYTSDIKSADLLDGINFFSDTYFGILENVSSLSVIEGDLRIERGSIRARRVLTTAKIPFGGNRDVCGNENKSRFNRHCAATHRDDVCFRPFRYAFIPNDGEILSLT